MPASLNFVEPGTTNIIGADHLYQLKIQSEDITYGDPIRYEVLNDGDTVVRDVTVEATGPGAFHVQLALDVDGLPGEWAEPGERILLSESSVFQDDRLNFWARPKFSWEDREGIYEFSYLFHANSLG